MNSAGNGCPCIRRTGVGLEHILKEHINRHGWFKTSRLQGKSMQSLKAADMTHNLCFSCHGFTVKQSIEHPP